jgi:hypothetical protein
MHEGWQTRRKGTGWWCRRCVAGDDGCSSSQATRAFFFVPNGLMLRLCNFVSLKTPKYSSIYTPNMGVSSSWAWAYRPSEPVIPSYHCVSLVWLSRLPPGPNNLLSPSQSQRIYQHENQRNNFEFVSDEHFLFREGDTDNGSEDSEVEDIWSQEPDLGEDSPDMEMLCDGHARVRLSPSTPFICFSF